VIDIGVLRSTLMEVGQWINGDFYNGRVVKIANSFVFKEPVFNYSGDFPFLWDEITVPVRYGSDYRAAYALLEKVVIEAARDYVNEAKESWKTIVEKFMIEDARVEPMVTLVANDNWMEFTVRYVVDYKVRRTTKDALFRRILEETARTKGKVALASATSELVGVPPITVRSNQTER
jgi:small-conductance mechanosensitive channel